MSAERIIIDRLNNVLNGQKKLIEDDSSLSMEDKINQIKIVTKLKLFLKDIENQYLQEKGNVKDDCRN